MSEKLKKKKKKSGKTSRICMAGLVKVQKKKIAEFKHHIKELKIELTWIQKSLQEG